MTGRDLEDQELALEFLEYIGWTIMGDAQNYRQTKERQEVLSMLREAIESTSKPTTGSGSVGPLFGWPATAASYVIAKRI